MWRRQVQFSLVRELLQVIFGINSSNLVPLETFKTDILITLNGWVGMVRDVKSRLSLRFSDGSKVVVEDRLAEELEDVKDKRDADCEFKRYDYYPGQVLCGPVKLVEEGQWSDCTGDLAAARRHKQNKTYKMTVEEISFVSIGVSWICRAYFSSDVSNKDLPTHPSFRIEGENLLKVKMLNVFEPCTLQIGDRNYYTLSDSDIVMIKSDWKRLIRDQLLDSNKNKTKPANKTANLAQPELLEEEENSTDYEDVEEGSASGPETSFQSIEEKGEKKKKKSQPGLTTKVLKKRKLRRSRKNSGSRTVFSLKAGEKVVTETLSTRSEVEVVWQDGTTEVGVPSSELYPVHHLDDHEFFPGDFVVEAGEEFQPHSYGVVQAVDHAERCCRVKWFRTYTGTHPQPIYVATSDNSVYDLKDHPDFKYRPGSIVIRVMNTAGEDCGLGAGQVLDNCPSGQVSVWWAGPEGGEGVTSSCWPQDLYKVGEYDSDEGDLWYDEEEDEDEEDGNESWETEEEEEQVGDAKIEDIHNDEKELKQKLASKIEKARIVMTRLEEIFSQNPNLQTPGVMKQLLEVYRDCRYLDKLMDTEFFHEREFAGLIERIKDQDRISSIEAAVKDQVNRLFSTEESPGKDSGNGSYLDEASVSLNDSVIESSEVPSHQVCGKLSHLIKTQLIKAHQEVVKRFGEVTPDIDEDTKTTLEDLCDLDALVARGLASLPYFLPSETEQTTGRGTSEDGCSVSTVEDVASPLLDKSFHLSTPLSPGSFVMADRVHSSHKFKLTIFQPNNMKLFMKHVKKELKLLQSSLPPGIVVKGYEERMDLFSAMIHGPKNTPYEDGLFFFDFQLPASYPAEPPLCHYISYCSDRLNPNLYEEGKVCVSLLGTWSGRGTETWTSDSNLLQLLVSIQGLILVREPYFNEAGYEKQKGTQQGEENSRMYNEMAVLKLVTSMTRMVNSPAHPFSAEIMEHMRANAKKFVSRMSLWRKMSSSLERSDQPTAHAETPDFPLIPASKGFCLTLDKALTQFKDSLTAAGVNL